VRTLTLLLLILAACGRPDPCEAGLCPTGTHCDVKTGTCKAVADALPEPVGVFGATSLLATPAGGLAVLGYAPARQSLVYLAGYAGLTGDPANAGGDSSWAASYLAGPAADAGEKPAGQVSAAVAAPDGRVHAAWLRPGDATLWYAVGGKGTWQREAVAVAAAGSVAGPIAIGLWQDQPTVAYRSADSTRIRVARRQGGGAWLLEEVPPPPAKAASPVDVGRSLAMLITPAGPVLAAYDAVAGDLLLAARGATGWSVARLAGTDVVTGADTGDVGRPLAMALGPGGDVVVAYRDADRGEVRIVRAHAGIAAHEVVTSGARPHPATGTVRMELVGTALAVAVLPDGRAVVAVQDATRLRVLVAVEQPSGSFAVLPAPDTGRAQAWPQLLLQESGAMVCTYVEIDVQRGPGGGRLVAWPVPTSGAPGGAQP